MRRLLNIAQAEESGVILVLSYVDGSRVEKIADVEKKDDAESRPLYVCETGDGGDGGEDFVELGASATDKGVSSTNRVVYRICENPRKLDMKAHETYWVSDTELQELRATETAIRREKEAKAGVVLDTIEREQKQAEESERDTFSVDAFAIVKLRAYLKLITLGALTPAAQWWDRFNTYYDINRMEDAIKWLSKAQAREKQKPETDSEYDNGGGDPHNAQWLYDLGMCYLHGSGGLKKNIQEACFLFKRAVQKGHMGAKGVWAPYLYLGNDALTQASYLEAAEAGDAHSQYQLVCLLKAGGVELKKASLGWCTKAAQQGHIPAQLDLARYYASEAAGEKRDFIKAINWCQPAVETQYSMAAVWELALIYDKWASALEHALLVRNRRGKEALEAKDSPERKSEQTQLFKKEDCQRRAFYWTEYFLSLARGQNAHTLAPAQQLREGYLHSINTNLQRTCRTLHRLFGVHGPNLNVFEVFGLQSGEFLSLLGINDKDFSLPHDLRILVISYLYGLTISEINERFLPMGYLHKVLEGLNEYAESPQSYKNPYQKRALSLIKVCKIFLHYRVRTKAGRLEVLELLRRQVGVSRGTPRRVPKDQIGEECWRPLHPKAHSRDEFVAICRRGVTYFERLVYLDQQREERSSPQTPPGTPNIVNRQLALISVSSSHTFLPSAALAASSAKGRSAQPSPIPFSLNAAPTQSPRPSPTFSARALAVQPSPTFSASSTSTRLTRPSPTLSVFSASTQSPQPSPTLSASSGSTRFVRPSPTTSVLSGSSQSPQSSPTLSTSSLAVRPMQLSPTLSASSASTRFVRPSPTLSMISGSSQQSPQSSPRSSVSLTQPQFVRPSVVVSLASASSQSPQSSPKPSPKSAAELAQSRYAQPSPPPPSPSPPPISATERFLSKFKLKSPSTRTLAPSLLESATPASAPVSPVNAGSRRFVFEPPKLVFAASLPLAPDPRLPPKPAKPKRASVLQTQPFAFWPKHKTSTASSQSSLSDSEPLPQLGLSASQPPPSDSEPPPQASAQPGLSDSQPPPSGPEKGRSRQSSFGRFFPEDLSNYFPHEHGLDDLEETMFGAYDGAGEPDSPPSGPSPNNGRPRFSSV